MSVYVKMVIIQYLTQNFSLTLLIKTVFTFTTCILYIYT